MKTVSFRADLEEVFDIECDPAVNKCNAENKSYESVVYMLEKEQHVEDDIEESCRGLEKRTEQGAWELYETQRDARNAVLGEQDDIKMERVADANEVILRIARAYSAVTERTRQAAYEAALKDQAVVQQYRASERHLEQTDSKQKDHNELHTSPLKSPAARRIVPWDRRVSMPLMDTKDEVEIKNRVDRQPIEKGVMEKAATKALDARESRGKALKKKSSKKSLRTKKADRPSSGEKTPMKQLSEKRLSRREKKQPVESSEPHCSDLDSRQKEKLSKKKLKEEIRELERIVAQKEAAKAKELAAQMSLGFQDTMKPPKGEKSSRKKPTKSASSRKIKGPSSPLPRQHSFAERKTAKLKVYAGQVDPLALSTSDLSTCMMTSSDVSSSSFDVDGSHSDFGCFLADDPSETSVPVESGQKKSKAGPLLSRFRLSPRKSARKSKSKKDCRHIGAESSCHF